MRQVSSPSPCRHPGSPANESGPCHRPVPPDGGSISLPGGCSAQGRPTPAPHHQMVVWRILPNLWCTGDPVTVETFPYAGAPHLALHTSVSPSGTPSLVMQGTSRETFAKAHVRE